MNTVHDHDELDAIDGGSLIPVPLCYPTPYPIPFPVEALDLSYVKFPPYWCPWVLEA